LTGFGEEGFTVVAKVSIGNEERLRSILKQIGESPAKNGILDLGDVPGLHFASLIIFPIDGTFRLLFEGNVDGSTSKFLLDLSQSHGPGLDAVFGLCDEYVAAERGSFLVKRDLGAGTFYVGCPGRSVDQIRREQGLRESIQTFLGKTPHGVSRSDVLQYIRANADLQFSQKGFTPPWLVRFGRWALAGIVLAILAAISLIIRLSWQANSMITGYVLLALILAAIGKVLFLLYLESVEKPFDNTQVRPEISEVIDLEDKGVANHLASITTIKPGVFRYFLMRFVFFVIRVGARFIANRGVLSGIPSIYFARWVIVERRHVVFLSNFGGSWETYLNDFIDEGHYGLTAVWSNTIGFPRTRGLIFQGATDELGFKVFARNSMVPSYVWYQAYPGLVTSNIENNTEIRQGVVQQMAAGSPEEQRWIARF
jgi:hypothetical protein